MQTPQPKPPAILAISSHVVRGSAGNRAMTSALEALGHQIWALPTVTLAHHPGHGPVTPMVMTAENIQTMAADLERNFGWAALGGIITGYFASADQVHAAAALIAKIKTANPRALYLCDPIIGDDGSLYVSEDIATAIRDTLLPLADIATPNRFECGWLVNQPDGDETTEADAVAAQARSLPPPTVIVTSVPGLMAGHIGNLLVAGERTILAEHRQIDCPVKGTGDVFAALFLARTLAGQDAQGALAAASASLCDLVTVAARTGSNELPLAGAQNTLSRPRSPVTIRHLHQPDKPQG